MVRQGMLILISGPSGCGKGTVVGELIKTYPYGKAKLSVSATTRNIRPGDVAGRDYYFMSRDEFEKRIKENGFLEWAEIYGNFYGTPASPVIDALTGGEDVILEIDVQGGLQIKKSFPAAILIFLVPPSRAVLEARLKGRGTDTQAEIARRLAWAETELGAISDYDYVVVNDRLEETVETVKCIIKAERSRSVCFKLPDGW